MINFLCKKIGSTSIYNKNGHPVPITIISVYNTYILKKSILNKKFYLILSYFLYHSSKKNIIIQNNVSNFDYYNFNISNVLSLNMLYINQKVDVVSISIGKGFSGVIKRHNFKSNYATHGNSRSHNKPGSIGMCQDPGRVLKGKKMAGRLGGKKVKILNSKIKHIDFCNRIIYLNIGVPGFIGSNVLITPSNI